MQLSLRLLFLTSRAVLAFVLKNPFLAKMQSVSGLIPISHAHADSFRANLHFCSLSVCAVSFYANLHADAFLPNCIGS
jgi:hypothetical protein